MMEITEVEKKDVGKFIELWQGKECLWNITSEDYQKKDIKRNAYERILEAFKNKYTGRQFYYIILYG